ncbi:MAG: hypothetical protein PHP06_11040, partial [Clostridia bacterium]|nr:hypothetical protein [Clostridia bacterium]
RRLEGYPADSMEIYVGMGANLVLSSEEAINLNSNGVHVDGDVYIPGFDRNTSGYTKILNGLILQWTIATIQQDAGFVTVTLPIVFPNQRLAVFATPYYLSGVGGSTHTHFTAQIAGSNQGVVTVYARTSSGGTPNYNARCTVFAIGY